MKKAFIYIGLTILLLVAAFLLSPVFFDISMEQLMSSEMKFTLQAINVMDGLYDQVWFIFAIAAIPLLQLLVSKIAKTKSAGQNAMVVGIIVLSGIIAWQLRIAHLLSFFEYQINEMHIEGITETFPIEQLHLFKHMTGGIVLGAVISALVFVCRACSFSIGLKSRTSPFDGNR